jgi:hypothetical protein
MSAVSSSSLEVAGAELVLTLLPLNDIRVPTPRALLGAVHVWHVYDE